MWPEVNFNCAGPLIGSLKEVDWQGDVIRSAPVAREPGAAFAQQQLVERQHRIGQQYPASLVTDKSRLRQAAE